MRKTLLIRRYHGGWASQIESFLQSLQADEKARKDPFHPIPRSKGEKARNRSRRGVR